MAVRRTKKQKAATQQKRAEQVKYSLSESKKVTSKTTLDKHVLSKTPKPNSDISALIRYDQKLIVGDLLKTVAVSSVIFGVLVALYFYM